MEGINVVGRFTSTWGIGIAARAVVEALIGGGVPVAIYDVPSGTLGRDSTPIGSATYVDAPAALPYKRTLMIDMPSVLAELLAHPLFAPLREHTLSLLLFWELEHIPTSWYALFEKFNHFFAPSRFVQESLRNSINITASYVPVTPLLEQKPLAARDTTQPFTFFTSYDLHSNGNRKNPAGVVDGYRTAFGEGSTTRLIVKAWESDMFSVDRALIESIRQSCPSITFVLGDHPYAEVMKLKQQTDVYISLHRCEGVGLGMLEAMSLGKPVIATDYSGSTDFVTEESGMPIPYCLAPIDGHDPAFLPETLGFDGVWAHADIAAAAQAMQRLASDTNLYQRLSVGAWHQYRERRQQFLSLRWLEPFFA